MKSSCFSSLRYVAWLNLCFQEWMSSFSKALCSIQGVLSQLLSRAQLTVDGHKLLTSGFNVSVADGRLALLLSYSPTASNQTATRRSLDTTLTAQFRGPILK